MLALAHRFHTSFFHLCSRRYRAVDSPFLVYIYLRLPRRAASTQYFVWFCEARLGRGFRELGSEAG
jgi:hypothetical protein